MHIHSGLAGLQAKKKSAASPQLYYVDVFGWRVLLKGWGFAEIITLY
jgi:hypothetical protein